MREEKPLSYIYSGCIEIVHGIAMSSKYLSDAARWKAVVERDGRADGVFFYAVGSTGIYCRPACPARLPRRDNVVFYDSAAAAAQAGYRACKRCRPEAMAPRAALMQQACAFIDARMDERFTLQQLGAALGLSPWHVQRLFKQSTGMTPRQYQEARRLARFKEALQDGATVAAATYEAGFGSSSRLYQSVKQLGMAPKAYRQRGAGMTIRYACMDSTLGSVLVAATEQGLCSVAIGESPQALEAALRAEFCRATLMRDDAGLQTHIEHIRAYLEGRQRQFDLPIDVPASAFRRRVWQLLQAIPYGQTRSYSELAAALGNPKAVRAVASACAANPLALVIPCHRALQKSGALAGFRWGLKYKQALLAAEREDDT